MASHEVCDEEHSHQRREVCASLHFMAGSRSISLIFADIDFITMHKERKDKSFIKKPFYPGGPAAMRNFIKQNLVYPQEALAQNVEGTVTLKYTIDHKGIVIDTHIIAGLGHGCDEEAERLVRLFKFVVPKTRGLRVTFHKDIHIHFRLPKKKTIVQKTPTQFVYVPTTSTPAKPSARGYSYTLTLPPVKKKP